MANSIAAIDTKVKETMKHIPENNEIKGNYSLVKKSKQKKKKKSSEIKLKSCKDSSEHKNNSDPEKLSILNNNSNQSLNQNKKRRHSKDDNTNKSISQTKLHSESMINTSCDLESVLINSTGDTAEINVKTKKKKKKNNSIVIDCAANSSTSATDISCDEPIGDEAITSKKAKKRKHKGMSNNDNEAIQTGMHDVVEERKTKKKRKKTEDTSAMVSKPENTSIDSKPDTAAAIVPAGDEPSDSPVVEHVSKEADILALKLETNSSLSYDVLATRSFESLRKVVSAPTMEAIESFGFTTMTEIQARAIPSLLEGKDLRGTAKTGSGKTLAFLIPAVELLHKLEFESCHGTGVLILCPTRELSMQTYGVVRVLADRHKFTHGLLIGGANRKAETLNLQKGINILVATPGRMLDHLKNTKGFQYGNLVCCVLDEADRMLSIGFEEEMKAILKVIPSRRQTMLFSATRTSKTDGLATMALKVSLVEVDVDEDKNAATVDQLTQSYLICPTEQRFLILYTFLKRKRSKKIMVFFSSCDAVRFYHDLLNYIDLPVLCIHGKQKQAKRTDAFYTFNAATSATLLCTDVAARGWDIPEVDWIVQYDPPEDPSEYIHRVGRTARGGKEGKALLMLREEELPFVRYLRSKRVVLNPIEVEPGKVFNIQRQLEKLMNKHYFLASSGRQAYKSYIHSYMKHRDKELFNVHLLDQRKVAKSFGFDHPPVIDMTINYDKKRSNSYKKNRIKW